MGRETRQLLLAANVNLDDANTMLIQASIHPNPHISGWWRV